MKNRAMENQRYRLIDTLRGISLLNMLAFHFLYDVYVIYGTDIYWPSYPGVVAWERYICMSFILISGVSLNFSRHAYRRGWIVNACGVLITLVTAIAMPDQIILFGILTCIGCAMLLTQAARRLLEKCNPFAGAAASFLLFAFFYGLPGRSLGFFNLSLIRVPDALYVWRPLALLGLPDSAFYSSDYFPLVPWVFLFICGFFLWRALCAVHADRFFRRGVPVLHTVGRCTLWIYMLHQPVLMGICFLIFGHF